MSKIENFYGDDIIQRNKGRWLFVQPMSLSIYASNYKPNQHGGGYASQGVDGCFWSQNNSGDYLLYSLGNARAHHLDRRIVIYNNQHLYWWETLYFVEPDSNVAKVLDRDRTDSIKIPDSHMAELVSKMKSVTRDYFFDERVTHAFDDDLIELTQYIYNLGYNKGRENRV